MKLKFHSVEITTEEDGREVLLFGTPATPQAIAFAKEILGEQVEIRQTWTIK